MKGLPQHWRTHRKLRHATMDVRAESLAQTMLEEATGNLRHELIIAGRTRMLQLCGLLPTS